MQTADDSERRVAAVHKLLQGFELQVCKPVGVGSADSREQVNWTDFDSCFNGLSSPADMVIGEWMLRRFIEIFETRTLQEYTRTLLSSPPAALKLLADQYTFFMAVIRRCGERLRMPELVPRFATNFRGMILSPTDPALQRQSSHRSGSPHSPPQPEPPAQPSAFLLKWLGQHGMECLSSDGASSRTFRRDEVLQNVHLLGLSSSVVVKRMWRGVLESVIESKASSVVEDLTTPHVENLLQWKERVLDQFCGVILSKSERELSANSDLRVEVDEWCQHCESRMLELCGRKLIGSLFDLFVDFPESRPALRDLRICLQRGETKTLRDLLIHTAKQTLRVKLQHAGTRTEAIITVLVATIRSFCVLFSKHEQSPIILDVIADTLKCLQRRKDSVAALVAEVTQSSSSFGSVTAGDERDNQSSDDEGADEAAGSGGQSNEGQPNALHLLLQTLNVTEIIRAYKGTLAEAIFQKSDYDCGPEIEVLERMKRIFGEESLCNCDVMLRDIQQSRRICAWIGAQPQQASQQQPQPPPPTSASIPGTTFVISHTCWPDLEVEKDHQFECHPKLQGHMAAFSANFKKMKPNWRLKWIPTCGHVNINITLRSASGPVVVQHKLSLLVASVVLYLQEAPGGSLTLPELGEKLKLKEPYLRQQIQSSIPALLVFTSKGALSLQKEESATGAVAFEAEAAASEAPSGMSPKEIEKFGNLVFNMVKTGGKKTAKQIENSMKMFGGYSGTSAEVASFLTYLVGKGKISTTDNVTFGPAAPK
jgi:anaphase-promoting complex subunit 2